MHSIMQAAAGMYVYKCRLNSQHTVATTYVIILSPWHVMYKLTTKMDQDKIWREAIKFK